MKKFKFSLGLIALVLSAVLVISGCGGQSEGTGGLVDGTYEGASDAGDKGYVAAIVKVEGGKIVDVEMREYRGDGTIKTPEDYTFEPWIEAVERLPQAVIEAQSADVDVITGATSSSEKFMQAVRRALGEEEQMRGTYTDGKFEGISDPSRTGYVAVDLVVQQGTVTHVEMREYRGDNTQKTKDNYDFEPWHTVVDELPAAVIEKQSAKVDVITAATGSSEKFMQAVRRALGEEKPYEHGAYKDGLYQAESDADDKGYVEVEVNILLGRVVAVAMIEYRGDGTSKTIENYDFESWHTALEELPASVIENQSADVDVVTEATGTSNKFMQAVERALKQAL